MKYWVIPEEMAEYDKRTIEEGVPADTLMERAGTAAAEKAMEMVSAESGPVVVFAGPGNNGGDGLVLARKLRERSYYAHVVLASPQGKSLSHDCQNNLSRFVDDGGVVLPADKLDQLPEKPSLAVDALLGTGFRGSLKGVFAECLKKMKTLNCPVLAVDTPSGINGRTGAVDPHAVEADVTVTFGAPKAGLLFPPGCGYTGSLYLAGIGIEVDPEDNRMTAGLSDVFEMLPPRPVDAHKGDFGRLMLVGGSESMPGAPQLMAMGAIRSGVGLATLAVPLSCHQLIAGRIPEALSAYFLPGDPTTMPEPGDFNAAVVGPGLGNNSSTKKIVSYILRNWRIPLVLDADGLNVLENPQKQLSKYGGSLILTPHPGEMARLRECDPSNIADRFRAATELSRSTGAVVLLKGKPTMVFHPERGSCLLSTGNSGMATGGSGDVLSGIAGALLAQGMDPFETAVLSAYAHGLAADIAVSSSSSMSLVPSDIAVSLGRAFRAIENGKLSKLVTSGGKWRSD